MIQAAWLKVPCYKCGAQVGNRCRYFHFPDGFVTSGHVHVARIAAGKAKRKGRHTGGRNKA